jgi:methylenetetrahydrofolate reductase (NADPH)
VGFAARLSASDEPFLLTAELDPPRGPDAARLVERARRLAPIVDAVNLTDGSLARVRLSGIAAAHLVQRQAGVEAVAHVTCRDRNVIALQADLLGAWALDVRAVLALSGDPPTQGDHPDAKPVFDVPDATALIRLVASLNAGRTAGGRELEGATGFLVGTAANPAAADPEKELAKLEARVEAGARFCQTQPVFDLDAALRFEEARRRRLPGVPVLYGILPLRGLDAARRFDGVPGMRVPDAIKARLAQAGPEREAEEGLRVACELARALAAAARGVHVFPLGRPGAVEAVAAALAEDGRRDRGAGGAGGEGRAGP